MCVCMWRIFWSPVGFKKRRAMNVLQTADVIAAEDTRTTGSLLKLLGLKRTGRLTSHHDHNIRRRVPEIVDAAR